MHPILTSLRLILCTLVLSACASSNLLNVTKASGSKESVQAAFGKPAVTKVLPDGERWIYTTAPEGRETWFVEFDASGQVRSQTQVLTDERVARIRVGQSLGDVEDLIGPSYFTLQYTTKPNELAHIYRFARPDAAICLYVHVDRANKVVSVGTADDVLGRSSGLRRPCL
jgi:hypothetical protein